MAPMNALSDGCSIFFTDRTRRMLLRLGPGSGNPLPVGVNESPFHLLPAGQQRVNILPDSGTPQRYDLIRSVKLSPELHPDEDAFPWLPTHFAPLAGVVCPGGRLAARKAFNLSSMPDPRWNWATPRRWMCIHEGLLVSFLFLPSGRSPDLPPLSETIYSPTLEFVRSLVDKQLEVRFGPGRVLLGSALRGMPRLVVEGTLAFDFCLRSRQLKSGHFPSVGRLASPSDSGPSDDLPEHPRSGGPEAGSPPGNHSAETTEQEIFFLANASLKGVHLELVDGHMKVAPPVSLIHWRVLRSVDKEISLLKEEDLIEALVSPKDRPLSISARMAVVSSEKDFKLATCAETLGCAWPTILARPAWGIDEEPWRPIEFDPAKCSGVNITASAIRREELAAPSVLIRVTNSEWN
ncbi:hypothetical protein H696_02526 [Fonticula alba]|uniref:Uncharacterized protein n=1 Tax=Fonticula alba TaxID=691883 RepID=A0A058ZCC9_FONAL|nr:hypothetical protein H696_02526 [Fonticula alba]KCV71588.1 hypothetical protein H696_02526 [Fonticula alba]|eukprot:XP_009494711.1 hypothetical protein H696_02526 [Fonticula alba]